MATVATNDPITIKEVLTLPSIGINPQFITFSNVTMESDKFICVIETSPQNRLVIIDMSMPMQPLRMSIKADSALMNPISKILALKAQLPETTQDYLQIFNIEMKASMKSHQMPEQVAFWKWITPKKLGLVTQTSVYHWSLEGDSEPVKMFDTTANLRNNQIISYKCDPTEKWLVLIGITPGSPERPMLLRGNMQLFSVDQQRSQALAAHAASFATLKVPGNENSSILISFATKILIAGQVTSKLHVIELGAQPGKPSFTKKQADLFFPPDFEDDFPVSMQISHKYGLIYVITNLLLLFVYDLETATAVYRNRISPDPIFLTCEATSVGGFYAVNRRGQVLLATVNESTIVPFVSEQKNNLELAASLAKRGTSSYSVSGSASSVIMIDSIGNDKESDLATVNESTIVPFVSEQKNNLELAVSLAKRGTSSYSVSGSASSVIMIDSIGNDKESDPSNSSSVQWSQQCRHFEFSEILLATKNFDESLVIGRGGFGKVYRGTIFNGSTTVIAAIKRLDSSSNQGAPEFWAEVEMLSKLRHCHLVSLFGYCNPEKEMILVYEYMPNGTLEDHLHKIGTPLSWLQRLKICIGAGRGLHYLHTGTGIDVGVIHRDVKTSNILLQESWAAKISDFGLSKMGPTNQTMTHVSTLMKGTFGYLDPDYYARGKLTRKSDVYSFGVVLLEVLCRKRAVFDIDEQAFNLAIWAQKSIKEDNLKNIIDPALKGQISSKCLKEFVRITERCLHSSPKKRSTMAEVLYSLESILSLQEKFNNSVQPAGRTILDRMVNMLPFPFKKENTAQGDSKSSSEEKSRIGTNTVGAGNNTFLDTSELPADYKTRSLKEFEYDDLRKVTKNFSPERLLGEGGFGKVYLGWVDQNTFAPSKHGVGVPVAVKRLNQESMQGLSEWQAEVSFLGRLAHPNIISLLGYCSNEHERLLVYEYMENKSFDGFLFTDRPNAPNTGEPLSWGTRLIIMMGVARGLVYLHSSQNQVMCRGVKAGDILLDKDFTAKLGDFGLVRCSPKIGESHVTTRVMGTYGYAAPEYIATGHLYVKSDIYSFGVVLLETLTGLRVLDTSRPIEKHNLVEWARPILGKKRKLKRIMDPRLEQNYPLEGAFKCAALALRCLENQPKDRPSSEEVLQSLEEIMCC